MKERGVEWRNNLYRKSAVSKEKVSSDINELIATIEASIQHKGFSIINVLSPCVTYNKLNTYDWFKQNLIHVKEIDGYDAKNRLMAMNTLMGKENLVTGIIFQEQRPSYQELVNDKLDLSLVKTPMEMNPELFKKLLNEFM